MAYYSDTLKNSEGNAKKTWDIMKEITGKQKIRSNQLPKLIEYNDKKIADKTEIAIAFNDFYISVGKNLASKIPTVPKTFESYLGHCNSEMSNNHLTTDELREAFKSLCSNKSPGVDEIDVYVVKKIFYIIEPILLYIFNLTFSTGTFPDAMKIARVTPIFKSGDKLDVSNFRPISVLPCFSKILEKLMYNRLYKYLTENNILYKKQFGFQKSHSTNHAIIELINNITNAFEKNLFTLGVFIDLSKAFDTVDHGILLHKLKHYGVTDTNLKWFKSYLTNRQQAVVYEDIKTNLLEIPCGVPQGSILGSLLFLIYINDIYKSSKLIDFILFADNTNLFYSHSDIKQLFASTNQELELINSWFKANKLSLNSLKTKYILFCKRSKLDNIPLKLPTLTINNTPIKREHNISFLGIMFNGTLNWKAHIETLENKISKNLGILYKAKPFLNLKCLKQLYHAFVSSYLNYCNIAWGSTNFTNLKKLFSKQKHACRIIFSENRNTSVTHRLKEIGALNVFQLNIFQSILFMFKVKNGDCPILFQNQFQVINHRYPTRYSKNSYQIPQAALKATRFSMQYRGPYLWNNILPNNLKTERSLIIFKRLLKILLLDMNIIKTKYF